MTTVVGALTLASYADHIQSGEPAHRPSHRGDATSDTQWHWQNPLPQGNNLRGASFVDANTGTVVGEYGTIVRTTDGGNSWTIQVSGTTQNLWAVSFKDSNKGTAVGEGGTILGTTDGGANWVPQTSGTTLQLRGVSLSDANTGTAVGEAAPFCGAQMAETAGFLNPVGPSIRYSVFLLSIRTQEQRSAERVESAEKAPFSERPMVAIRG